MNAAATPAEPTASTPVIAVAETREAAARVFAGLGADLIVTTYDEWQADLAGTPDATVRRTLAVAAGHGMLPVLSALDLSTTSEVVVELPRAEQETCDLRAALADRGLGLVAAQRSGDTAYLRLAPGQSTADPVEALLAVASLDVQGSRLQQEPIATAWTSEAARERSATGDQPAATSPTPHRTDASATPGPPTGRDGTRRGASGGPSSAPRRAPTGRVARMGHALGLTTGRRRRLALAAGGLAAAGFLGVAVAAVVAGGLIGLLTALLLVGVLGCGVLLVRLLMLVSVIVADVDRHRGALGRLERRVTRLDRRTRRDVRRVARLVRGHRVSDRRTTAQIRRTLSRLPGAPELESTGQRVTEQVQAFDRLRSAVDLPLDLPALGRFTASADVLAVLADTMIRERPRLVVESGSGVSTLVMALVAQQHDLPCRIVALEHSRYWAADTVELLARHGVAGLAEVRFAPLERTTLPAHRTPWYAAEALEGLQDVGLLFVDGPPGSTGPSARYPMLPMLVESLAPDCSVIADDTRRPSDNEVVQRWHQEFPGFDLHDLGLEKGALLLRRRAT